MATTKKKLTASQKYNQLKRQTESAGMKVKEVDGKIVVTRKKKIMIKNFKDIVVLLITTGVLTLLGIIIIGDYWVAVKEDRPIDDSISYL